MATDRRKGRADERKFGERRKGSRRASASNLTGDATPLRRGEDWQQIDDELKRQK